MVKRKSASQILKKRAMRPHRSIVARILRWCLFAFLVAIISGAAIGIGAYFYVCKDLPVISSLTDYAPPVITTVYSDDNRKIAEFYRERRILLPLSEMPELLKQAFIAAEDARFYQHKGIDLQSILRAFIKNLKAGTIVQGGSTITQQVAKSFFLTPEKIYIRKIKEAILAYRIDSTFSKEEVLYLYLNQIYLGHSAYGVEAAAENYFGKSAAELNLAECAMIAGLPQAPSRYSPFRFPNRARQRQIYVLSRMVEEGYISTSQKTKAMHTQLDIKPRRNWYIEKAPYYTEHVRQIVEKKYGTDKLYDGGLKIYTAVNIEMQKDGRDAVVKGLLELDKRQGYRGPIEHLSPSQIEGFSETLNNELQKTPLAKGETTKAVVIAVNDKQKRVIVRMGSSRGTIRLADMRWARKPNPDVAYSAARINRPGKALSIGDVIWVKLQKQAKDKSWQLKLEQTPKAQAALLCIEHQSGHVKTMIGGRDFKDSQFNRAIQSRRQPGSAFKPVIYAAALDKGFTPASVIVDSAIVYQDAERDFTWKPKNYKKKFYGPTLLRKALAKSRNVVTIKILKEIGIDYAIEYARKLGIESPLSKDLSIALGSSGVSLLELVGAYSVFDNLGERVEPVFITRIEDRYGNVLEETEPAREKVIDPATAYIMTNLLEEVVKHGTGRRVRALGRPAAGKTGTTNNLFDAWFVGYTPHYVTGAWVGFDEESPLGRGETGSRAASPIWLGFMQKILKDAPVEVFQVPENVVFTKIDAETGLLPIPTSTKTVFECFKEGTVPTDHTRAADTINDTEQFFKSAM